MFMRGSVGIATVILMSGINAEVPSAGLCGPGTVLDGGLVSFFAFLKKIKNLYFSLVTSLLKVSLCSVCNAFFLPFFLACAHQRNLQPTRKF